MPNQRSTSSRLGSVAAWLDRRLLAAVCAVAVVGVAWPAPARHAVHGHAITIALVVLVAAVGLGLDASSVTAARQHSGRARPWS